jgi:hypothetical protein
VNPLNPRPLPPPPPGVPGHVAPKEAAAVLPARRPRVELGRGEEAGDLGFGGIVASDIKAPNMFANLV